MLSCLYKYCSQFLYLFVVQVGQADCLVPQVELDKGSFVVESCAYHSTTGAVYEDPRLMKINGSDYKNPVSVIGANKTKGKPRILLLSPSNQAILLRGKMNNQTTQTAAFLRTKDRQYCEKMIKDNVVEVVIHEMCCDCMNSCVETPCALGTKNEIKNIKFN